jgi:hypothetical protein
MRKAARENHGNYIIRIYRFEKNNPRHLVGIVSRLRAKKEKSLHQSYSPQNAELSDTGDAPSSARKFGGRKQRRTTIGK